MSNENIDPIEAQDAANSAPTAQPTKAREGASLGEAFARVIRQPTFMIVAGVLLLAAVGLNFAVRTMQLHFKKEPLELAHALGTISPRFGSWVQVSQDQPLDKEMQDVLGTDKYVFREYVNETATDVSVANRFTNKTAEERRIEVNKIRGAKPSAVVSLSVTYYTGMVDTVAHVPDRCVTADGYEPKSYEIKKWPIARDLPARMKSDGDNIEVRYINFEDQTGTSNVPRSIAYFFHVDGQFDSDPLGVRNKLANLFEKKAYYAKIEVMTTVPDARESERVLSDFLTSAMPEIHRCMPDWEKEHGRGQKTEVAQNQ